MITESTMYWLTRMDYFQKAAAITGCVLLFVTLIWVVIGAIKWGSDNTRKPFFTGLLFAIISLLILISAAFIPTTKEMCVIKAIPMIVNNEQVQELPNKVVELANEWINELKPNKDSE